METEQEQKVHARIGVKEIGALIWRGSEQSRKWVGKGHENRTVGNAEKGTAFVSTSTLGVSPIPR